MWTDPRPTGTAGLLRVAGLPAAVLARAGDPELFDRIRRRDQWSADYAALAGALAARLGEELVGHPDLSGQVRGQAVTLRRRLRRGTVVDPLCCRRLAVVSAVLDGLDGLVDDLLAVAELAAGLAAEDAALAEAVRAEQIRVAALAWEILTEVPAARRIVTEAAPGLFAELGDRLAAGESWTGKRLRQRADYVLRLLARAACKTTPRGWFGHVAVAPSAPGPPDDLVVGLRVGDTAVHRVGNIAAHRHALAAAEDLPEGWLSMPGLHWVHEDRLCCWTGNPDTPGGSRFVRVRLTQGVDAVRRLLGGGVMRTEDVVAVLAPAADEHRRRVLRGFLHHLVRVGAVQVSARPPARLHRWSSRPRAGGSAGGFVDVYRLARGHVSTAATARLGELVAQAARLHALVEEERAEGRHPALDLVDDRPRPVTEIVAAFLDGREPRPARRPRTGWPTPRPGTAYARLCHWLHDQAGDAEIDITPTVLDRIGAPPARRPTWPVDCLVRPLPSGKPLAVLEAVLPAGVADARFADTVRQLHEEVSFVDTHRAFLTDAAARCGVEAVEVLVPPHGERGANTVRRPRYTDTWTGDADAGTYLPDSASGRYLPLGQITVRRVDGRVVAEDPAGRPLWPVCHATLVPPAPWDVVLAVLAAAAPVGRLAVPMRFGDHTGVFPGRHIAPRIVLDRGLVLAGRSVLLPRDRLPAPGAPLERRVRELAALRPATGAPRWNFVRAAGSGRPRPVDLDSVTALRTLDRLLADPGVSGLVLEEMLPDPDSLSVRDESGQRLAAQLLIRLPHGANPVRLADDAARAWLPRPLRFAEVATVAG